MGGVGSFSRVPRIPARVEASHSREFRETIDLHSSHEPSQQLFREEAFAAHSARLLGEVNVAQPLSHRLWAAFVTLAIIALGAFASTHSYPRSERVSGYLTSSVGVSKIEATRAGMVASVRVKVGDFVERGQVIVTIESDEVLASGTPTEAAFSDALDRRTEETRAKLDLENRRFAQARIRAGDVLVDVESQIAQLTSQRELARERVSLAKSRLSTSVSLQQRGVRTSFEVDEERDRLLGLRSALADLERALLERREARHRGRSELDALVLQHEAQLSDLRLELSDIESRRTELERRASYALRAPVTGYVAALQVTTGMAAEPAVPVAILVPAGGKLEARLFVPTRAIGFLEVGQRVGLEYAAFPHTQFGIQTGSIDRIDSAVLSPSEIDAPVQIREAVYNVVVKLDSQKVEAYGRQHPLQLGMAVEGEILIEERSLIDWLLEPLYTLRKVPR